MKNMSEDSFDYLKYAKHESKLNSDISRVQEEITPPDWWNEVIAYTLIDIADSLRRISGSTQ